MNSGLHVEMFDLFAFTFVVLNLCYMLTSGETWDSLGKSPWQWHSRENSTDSKLFSCKECEIGQDYDQFSCQQCKVGLAEEAAFTCKQCNIGTEFGKLNCRKCKNKNNVQGNNFVFAKQFLADHSPIFKLPEVVNWLIPKMDE